MSDLRTWIAVAGIVLGCALITTVVSRVLYGARGTTRALPAAEAARRVGRARTVGYVASVVWLVAFVSVLAMGSLEAGGFWWYLGASTLALVAVLLGAEDPRELETLEEVMSRKDR